MKVPCELFVWYVLPGIRQELARSLVEDFNLTQVIVAEKLDLTEAAISQYLSNKRGNLVMNKFIKKEIKESAKLIVEGDEMMVVKEICRICALVKESDIMPRLYREHTNISLPDYELLLE